MVNAPHLMGVWLLMALAILPAHAAAQEFRLQPSRAIEALGPFENVSGLTESADGGVVLIQTLLHRITFFDPSGKRRGMSGGKGDGPGDFRSIGPAGWVADTLWISDVSARRTSLFTRTGSFIRSEAWLREIKAMSGNRQAALGSGVFPVAQLPTGQIVKVNLPIPQASPKWFPAWRLEKETPLARVSRTGTIDRVIAWVPKGPPKSCIIKGPGGAILSAPYCNATILSISSTGDRLAIAIPSEVPGSLTMVVLHSGGDTVWTRTIRHAPVRLSPTDKKVLNDRLRDLPPQLATALRSRIPEVFPALEQLLVGIDGTVWVGRRQADGGLGWTIFSAANGTTVGELKTPPKLMLHSVSTNHVWTTENSSTTGTIVRRYDLIR